MKTYFKWICTGIMCITVLVGCGNTLNNTTDVNKSNKQLEETQQENVEILVSSAASLKEAMEQVKALYETSHEGVTITFTFGGSGALQQQIEQGAPTDVFISAAEKQMNILQDEGLILEDTRTDLLENKVVLIAPSERTDINGFEDVATDKVGQIGLGEPGSVPVGQYAEEIFTSLNILDTVKPKAVYGKDVKEVLSWVETGNVDAGVVYATDAKTTGNVNIVAIAPEGSSKPAIYPVAVIKDSNNIDKAKEFVEFLKSEEIRNVFEGLGFVVK